MKSRSQASSIGTDWKTSTDAPPEPITAADTVSFMGGSFGCRPFLPHRSTTLIQLSRLLAKQLRTVLKKTFGIGNISKPDLHLTAGDFGLLIRAQNQQH